MAKEEDTGRLAVTGSLAADHVHVVHASSLGSASKNAEAMPNRTWCDRDGQKDWVATKGSASQHQVRALLPSPRKGVKLCT